MFFCADTLTISANPLLIPVDEQAYQMRQAAILVTAAWLP
jgi:hypothetical protein